MKNKTYAEICADAKQLQECWEPKLGDKYYGPPDIKSIEVSKTYKSRLLLTPSIIRALKRKPENKVHFVWLPRQEDLQAMLDNGIEDLELDYCYNKGILVTGFYKGEGLFNYDCRTFEETWVMIIMEQRFGKRWCSKYKKWAKAEKIKKDRVFG